MNPVAIRDESNLIWAQVLLRNPCHKIGLWEKRKTEDGQPYWVRDQDFSDNPASERGWDLRIDDPSETVGTQDWPSDIYGALVCSFTIIIRNRTENK